MRLRRSTTEELSPAELASLESLVRDAFADDPEPFTEKDWQHGLGGMHFVVEEGGRFVAHASVIERELHAGEHRLRTGYVEAVATLPGAQGRGYGSAAMREVAGYIHEAYELGALATARPGFYERLGWVLWSGPTYVRTDSGMERTAEDDGGIMIRRTRTTPDLDLSEPISCEWRPGDVW